MHREREGELFIIGSGLLWGLFPVLTILSFSSVPPFVSLGWSTVVAAGFFAVIMTVRKRWKQLNIPSTWPNILATTFWSILYYVFVFWALQTTSAGNESIIALSEVFFSFIFFNCWKKEFISTQHILGAILTVVGAIIVLSPNLVDFHPGDVLVLIASAIAPFVNFFQRRARKQVATEGILFVRNAILGIGLLCILTVTGKMIPGGQLHRAFPLLIVNGVVLFGLTKIFWLESIHRISVTKANALSCIAPFVTLLVSLPLLHTAPTIWQISAIIPMCIGVALLGTRPMDPRPDLVNVI